jgi:hypothetical protein
MAFAALMALLIVSWLLSPLLAATVVLSMALSYLIVQWTS